MVRRWFKTLENLTFDEDFHDVQIPSEWQSWEEAYFSRVALIVDNPHEPAILITSGCDVGDGGPPNCTKVCSDKTLLFSSVENLRNCMTLATVTMLTVPVPEVDDIDVENMEKMGRLFNFNSLKDFDKIFVFKSIRECLWQSCSDSKYGKCAPNLVSFQCTPINQYSIDEFGSILKNEYCQDAAAAVDGDIAGQGVGTVPHLSGLPALTGS